MIDGAEPIEIPESRETDRSSLEVPMPSVESEEIVEQIEPWEEAIELSELVEEIENRIERHLIVSHDSRLAVALWVAGAYVYDSFRIFPRVVIHSPEKRCGKSTLMEMLQAMVPRAILASNVSPAAVFRVIEKYHPTLLIDEADSFLRDNEPLRGVINSSHSKATAHVLRCEGDQHTVRKFSTWAPIVLAGIQQVADTIMDRSLVVELQRKGHGETVERLPVGLAEALLPLRRKLTRWGLEHGNLLRTASPQFPESNNDRAEDNWFPLFALADFMGGEWPMRTTAAFLSAVGQVEEETTGTMLLSDVRAIFKARGVDRIWSCDLVNDLNDMEERPWGNWRGGFTARVLSNMLKGYKIYSADIRMDRVKKGYQLSKCREAFTRYLPPDA
ncbi:MAG: DUF3631 domain-containing protein [Verrucomicrobia bacterium]|nr:DUF3631 domain-containing protein [Verrucomicrobiota bacterium]